MKYSDKTTGLEIGDAQIIPLKEIKTENLHQKVNEQIEKTILSASGWRKIFAQSGEEEDKTDQIGEANAVIAAHMAAAFAGFIKAKSGKEQPKIVLGCDSRPTGRQIADIMIRVLTGKNVLVEYIFIAAAPEIMAYGRLFDGFVYISASHNPIGHNGVKFGLNDGGVIAASDAIPLAENFKAECLKENAVQVAAALCSAPATEKIDAVFAGVEKCKKAALNQYRAFTMEVISTHKDEKKQQQFAENIKNACKNAPVAIVCDFNGSARSISIDKELFASLGIDFFSINSKCGQIAHTIIPEPENLVYCAEELARVKAQNDCESAENHSKKYQTFLGYMPDCDGDRGNIVFFDSTENKPRVLKAQEVFALSVLAELAALAYENGKLEKTAVVVNDPTSMRIEKIASAFGAQVFRAEVGEANVVNLARLKRSEGYTVRILGEGSNGGNITHPAAVRDPLNTIFALIKLLTIKDQGEKPGLFHTWCKISNQEKCYKNDFDLADVIKTLPVFTTTGVSEKRAVAGVTQKDHAKLKAAYQKVFEKHWNEKRSELLEKYGIADYVAICNNGTNEKAGIIDYSVSGKGGLKVLFKDAEGENCAFIWMRGSGTEPVFRVMCDVRGENARAEAELLEWHTRMLLEADALSK